MAWSRVHEIASKWFLNVRRDSFGLLGSKSVGVNEHRRQLENTRPPRAEFRQIVEQLEQ